MCSETSPRISFSGEAAKTDVIMQIQETDSLMDMSLLESNSDFEFSFGSSFCSHESCSADELFFNGVILPTQIRETQRDINKYELSSSSSSSSSVPPAIFHCDSHTEDAKQDSEKEAFLVSNSNSDQKSESKSFWGFKRCNSLNYEGKMSLLCSLPLLSRSSSTSSVPTSKLHRQSSQKQPFIPLSKSSSSSQRPPLKKNYGGPYNSNGVGITPVLNVPPPYISKGASNLFGFGTFLSSRRDHKKKKPKK